MMDKPEQLVECYPEIMPGATAWCRGDERREDGQLTVTDDGLRHLLRLISALDRVLLDALMAAAKRKPWDGCLHIPVETASKLLARTGQVWCEGDLVVSGLFVVDGQPVISRSTEVELLGSEPRKAGDDTQDPA
jgi:hypothetical protein